MDLHLGADGTTSFVFSPSERKRGRTFKMQMYVCAPEERESHSIHVKLKIKQRDPFSQGGRRLMRKVLLHGDTFNSDKLFVFRVLS